MTGAPRDADAADGSEDQIFGADAQAKLTLDIYRQGFGSALQQALCRQYMRDFSRADTEGQGAKCAVRAGMAVAADHDLARLSQPQFGADDVHDATQVASQVEKFYTILPAVAFELGNLVGG